MHAFFFYGTLCHQPLLEVVLGRKAKARQARLENHATYWAEGESFPLIREEQGAVTEGLLVTGIGDEEAARLDFYEGGFGYATRVVPVETNGVNVSEARIFFPDPRQWKPGKRWRLAEWEERWAPAVVEAARDFMAAYGKRSPQEVLARYPRILARAASRLRARQGGPATLRSTCGPQDVEILRHSEPYAGFFAVEEASLRFRRFDGEMSDKVERSAFVTGDVVTILPYDPVRDRVLLVEQFRFGPLSRGDARPWLLEPIAGRIDAGETPEQAARREAEEETGLTLSDLRPMPAHYSSPGMVTEYIYAYLAVTELPDSAEGIGGLDDESEDIRAHVVSFDRLMELCRSGEAESGPLLLSAFWLAAHRDVLRGAG